MSKVNIKRLQLDNTSLRQQLREISSLLQDTTYATSRLLYTHFLEVNTALTNLRVSLYNRGLLHKDFVFSDDNSDLSRCFWSYLVGKYDLETLRQLEFGKTGIFNVKDVLFINYRVNRLRNQLSSGVYEDEIQKHLVLENFCSDMECILEYLKCMQIKRSLETLLGNKAFVDDVRLRLNTGLSLTWLEDTKLRWRVPLRFWSGESYLYSGWNGLTTREGYSYVYDENYFYDKVILGVVEYFEIYANHLVVLEGSEGKLDELIALLGNFKQLLCEQKGQWVFLSDHVNRRSKESYYLELLYDGRLVSDTEVGKKFFELRDLVHFVFGELIFQKVVSALSLYYLSSQLKEISELKSADKVYVQHITSFGVFIVPKSDVSKMRDIYLPLILDIDGMEQVPTEFYFSGVSGNYDVTELDMGAVSQVFPALREGKICIGQHEVNSNQVFTYLTPTYSVDKFVDSVDKLNKQNTNITVIPSVSSETNVLDMLIEHFSGSGDFSILRKYALVQYGIDKQDFIEFYDLVKGKVVLPNESCA